MSKIPKKKIIITSSQNIQSIIEIPAEFKETIFPESFSSDWFKLNHADDFGVSIVNDKLHVKKIERTNICELKIDTGTLKGVNNGEWGGRLTFIPNDPSKKEITVAGGNIISIFRFKDKIYFIEGFAHLTFSFGAMYELNIVGKKFIEKRVIDFIDAPSALTIYDDKILIVTRKKFYIIKGYRKRLILKNAFWECLYPTSVVAINDENVFIGMRGGIAKLNLTNKDLFFYTNCLL